MLPFSTLLEIFPKMIRDLSRDQGKEVELVIMGSEVEIDKRILEEMKDPLIHLLRNCIDHGIEKPEERIKNKKQPRGIITIAISQIDSNKIEIYLSDDGAGIDLEKVKKAAVKSGIISEEDRENLPEQEIYSLIFQSEVSTSPMITDLSGRGLGLAIVRERVEKLGGYISVQTEPHRGTVFRLLLPLTIATYRGIIVQAGDQLFAIPIAKVERVMRIKPDEIKTVENRETIVLNGRTIPLVCLTNVLEISRMKKQGGDSHFIPVVILGSAERRIAFSVDKILSEHELLVKSLGKNLSRVRNIAGATVLGSGRAVPILNVSDVMKSAVRLTSTSPQAAVTAGVEGDKKKSILVVEDSITSRMLLKNILEAAGYLVKTAVDGLDAWTALRIEEFDLVVSDVDMPRMNGFDLTSKIRSDKKLAELPLILVTALESREDRERGIDVGANAYMVKRSFDQSNLLEVIQRLI
jgi:two-component system chemotaxis sensor kinase CheA